ncbi:MAG: NTP transferase domain-containing protein [Desulfobulbaceae bacterium]|nr:NTP transferase domain-containing protein [Desulfobulbaceae bacterium]
MDTDLQAFTAIVLAADRETANPVAKAAGVRCKSLAPINGTPMIFRVLEALSSSNKVKNKLLCGPPKKIIDQEPKLTDCIASGKATWIANQATPSLSAHEAMKSLPEDSAILLTTSDHALLTPEIVDYFCHEAQESGCDVVVGLARHETVMAAYPETSRTAYRFKDGAYCSCNLFAFLTPQARTIPSFWRRVEQQRKKPLRVISILGWNTVLLYLLRNLTLSKAVERISQRLGCRTGIVVIPYPEAAVDVDSAEDLHLVQQIAVRNS